LRVAILGRIAPEKGHLDFIRAAATIGDRAMFAVYGDSSFSDPGYARAVRKEAIGRPIKFHGWQSDIGRVLRDVDILAVPSFSHEAAGRVIIEAFSACVPVVAYPSGGIPEIIHRGRTGLLTDRPTPECLARSIAELLKNDDQRRGIALAGRAEWQRRFTLEAFQTAVCETISHTVNAQHSSQELRSRSSSRASRRMSSL
jgi:glycosyltransferase involved in cell wall biosynthesis